LLDLQYVVGIALDGLGEGVPMERCEQQRPEDEEVECALQELDSWIFSRHSR